MGQYSLDEKEKITLTEAQETLLIPLFCKSRASQSNRITFEDAKTEAILAGIAYDFEKLKVPKQTAVTVRMRAKKLDEYARIFLDKYPDTLVLHLGCGLDSRFERVDNGRVHWIDLDLPGVIALRRKFYVENASTEQGRSGRYRMVASSVTNLEWLHDIDAPNKPVLIIAEGLFMYLHESDIQSLLLAFKVKFSKYHLIFDAFSALTARRVGKHPSLAKTGARIHWGIDDAKAIENWVSGLKLIEEWYFSQSEDVKLLDWWYRTVFKIAGSFMMANKAHRILYYKI